MSDNRAPDQILGSPITSTLDNSGCPYSDDLIFITNITKFTPDIFFMTRVGTRALHGSRIKD